MKEEIGDNRDEKEEENEIRHKSGGKKMNEGVKEGRTKKE